MAGSKNGGPPPQRTLEETIERELIRMLRKRKPREGKAAKDGAGVSELSASERIRTLAVAVRFAAVKKGLSGDEGSGFEEDE